MTLIKSISGIRGTIGGKSGDGLSPLDTVKFVSAYCQWLINNSNKKDLIVVVGRDARISGEMVSRVVIGTIMGMGIDVINIDLATTPTTEIAVTNEKADGGIILTASHNPKQWNALKLLNEKGEFLSADDGSEILKIAEQESFVYAEVDNLGSVKEKADYLNIHIKQIIELPLVDIDAIKAAEYKIVIDAVNSVGGIAIPELLRALGVKEIIELYCEPNGIFPHNPEPIPEHLTEISKVVKENNAHLGFVVDPDVDRLAIVNEDGSMFGEEYTLVAVSDYILKNKAGNTVSNLSSSRALRDVTRIYGGEYFASAVGEVNVVEIMKAKNAVIGGEGNGGVIYPDLHYGRDALVGIALFLSHLAKTGCKCSDLRSRYPEYVIAKKKMELTPGIDVDKILVSVKEQFSDHKIIDIDGVKIEFEIGWVHLRKSNTEPIIRIYAESSDKKSAEELAENIISKINSML
ncbi:MAG: phosphoglucosamine mutase [Bacteroidales bacterium]|nr:phosphoglucosamine mutase [Bacteroidales bacterium]